jgi:hypothetical protein
MSANIPLANNPDHTVASLIAAIDRIETVCMQRGPSEPEACIETVLEITRDVLSTNKRATRCPKCGVEEGQQHAKGCSEIGGAA